MGFRERKMTIRTTVVSMWRNFVVKIRIFIHQDCYYNIYGEVIVQLLVGHRL